jgi:hypothetical protein
MGVVRQDGLPYRRLPVQIVTSGTRGERGARDCKEGHMAVVGEAAIRPQRLRLVQGGAYDSSVLSDEGLRELLDLLNRLAERADPVRAAVLRAWSRTVRLWLRSESP